MQNKRKLKWYHFTPFILIIGYAAYMFKTHSVDFSRSNIPLNSLEKKIVGNWVTVKTSSPSRQFNRIPQVKGQYKYRTDEGSYSQNYNKHKPFRFLFFLNEKDSIYSHVNFKRDTSLYKVKLLNDSIFIYSSLEQDSTTYYQMRYSGTRRTLPKYISEMNY